MGNMFKYLGMTLVAFLVILALAILGAKHEGLLVTYSIIPVLAVFLYPRISCALQVYKIVMSDVKGQKLDKVLCYIPIYNTYYIRKLMYDKAPVVGGLLLYVAVELFVMNPVLKIAFRNSDINVIIYVLLTWLNLLSVLILWGVEMFVNFRLAKNVSTRVNIVQLILTPWSTISLASKAKKYFKDNKNILSGVFDEEER